jgi:hypothetical protein
MWSLWRVHDVMELGTKLDPDGRPAVGARALPDGEIERGTPIPAVVPMPSLAMAPIPARIRLTNLAPFSNSGQGRRAEVIPDNQLVIEHARHERAAGIRVQVPEPVYRDPGYPFFIPGVAGHRAPHPPLDFAWRENANGEPIDAQGKPTADPKKKVYLNGGLPRHVILDGTVTKEFHTRWDFTKDVDKIVAFELPEDGTRVEQAAMAAHSTRTRPTPLPNGQLGNFLLNGLPPTFGAPYANPSVNDDGEPVGVPRRYQAAVIQRDVVFNKKGWHFPQQRFITLWGDIKDTIAGSRAPQPFFFRATTGDSILFWHTNLVPAYYELDDFQVRTPTDVIGQHIHLVKFDVTSSDGAGNGFNYEDGTFSPDEVRERIEAINKGPNIGQGQPASDGIYSTDPLTGFINPAERHHLTIVKYKDAYPRDWFGENPSGQNWDGAQTTIQRWDTDPLLNIQGVDRTLRTVFSHDHFGPSTHQQVGLYAGLLVEPTGSKWFLPNGKEMNVRSDGGPTSWEGIIVAGNQKDFAEDSFREFALEFQDSQLAYQAASPTSPSKTLFDPTTNNSASAAFNIGQAFSQAQMDQYRKVLNTPPQGSTAANPGTLPAAFPTVVFPTFGIPLSPQAAVTILDAAQTTWKIQEPQNAPVNAGTTYIVKATNPQTVLNPVTNQPLIDPVTNQPMVAYNAMLVYTPDIPASWASPANALNPPPDSKNAGNGPPFPQIITNVSVGTYSFNYRNEPIPFRITAGTDPVTPANQSLAHVFRSIPRSDPQLNQQPAGAVGGFNRPFPPLLVPGAQPDDPYTPLMRAYQGDNVQVRTLVGAHLQAHVFQMHGVRWTFEPSYANSGYRAAQSMGISEHFEMLFKLPTSATRPGNPFTDYFLSPSSDTVGLNNGLWGIVRTYDQQVGSQPGPADRIKGVAPSADYLKPLPNNPIDRPLAKINFKQGFDLAPPGRRRVFEVTATTVAQALRDRDDEAKGRLIYNSRVNASLTPLIFDEKAVIFVRSEDLTVNDKTGTLRPDVVIEPLILRASAGDWIQVKLTNAVDPTLPAFTNSITQPAFSPFSNNPLPPVPYAVPPEVGLHPQLVSYDAGWANGLNVGFNRIQTVKPGDDRTDYWFAGALEVDRDGRVVETPMEFGSINLIPADMQTQHQRGLYGALIVEPRGSAWVADRVPAPDGSTAVTQASATVTRADGAQFREFVVVLQNDTSITGPDPVQFECTVHKQHMTGGLTIQPAQQTLTISAILDRKATPTLQWSPKAPTVRVGDTIEWRIDNIPAASVPHGVMFLDWDTAKDALDLLPGGLPFGPQPGFNPPAQGTPGTSTQGALILRAKVKAVPAGGAAIPYECTIHKQAMTGSLTIQPAQQTTTILATFDSKANPPLQWSPRTPTVRVGDTLEWKIDNVPASKVPHGVMFFDWDSVKQVLNVQPGGLPIGPQPGFPGSMQGTAATSQQDTLLVKAQVRGLIPGAAPPLGVAAALNYRSEPFSARSNPPAVTALGTVPASPPLGYARALANLQVHGNPNTPIFEARAGTPVRFRAVFPGGTSIVSNAGYVFEIEGHVWQDEPYLAAGTVIGFNPLSNWRGMQQIFPYEAYNILIPSAGGTAGVPGDYLYQTYQKPQRNGTWGLFRVTP